MWRDERESAGNAVEMREEIERARQATTIARSRASQQTNRLTGLKQAARLSPKEKSASPTAAQESDTREKKAKVSNAKHASRKKTKQRAWVCTRSTTAASETKLRANAKVKQKNEVKRREKDSRSRRWLRLRSGRPQAVAMTTRDDVNKVSSQPARRVSLPAPLCTADCV